MRQIDTCSALKHVRDVLRRLPLRLMLFAVLPLLLASFAGGYWLLRSLEREFERRMQEDVQMVARALHLPLTHAMERNRDGSIQKSLQSAFEIGRVYGAYLYNRHGELVASFGRVRSPADQGDVDKVLEDGQRRGGYGSVGGQSVYSYFVPLGDEDSGRMLGLLQITRRARDFDELMHTLRIQAFSILGVAAILMTVIVLVGYYGAAGRALARLAASMQRVETGDRAHRAAGGGPREIQTVASSLNAMLDSIEGAHERIRREQESRAQLEAELRQSEKLAAIGRLAGGVAHELGTPLSVVDGRMQRALRHAELEPRLRSSLQAVRSEVRRMERIVRQLLDFGRNHSSRRSDVSVARLVSTVQHGCEDAFDGEVRVEFEAGDGIVSNVDPVRLEQALRNLVENATQAARQLVEVGARRERGSIVFQVDDDGPGVPAELVSRLFEPFFTTKRGQEGTGLGLAIAYAVAQEHGGAIDVGDSHLGGARFSLWLPAASSDARSIGKAASA